MNNSCGITRSKSFEQWPRVKLDCLKPVSIPFETPEERGDSQPYPVPNQPTDYTKLYNHGPSWIAEAAIKESYYEWPGVMAIW